MRKHIVAPAIALLLTAALGAGPAKGPPECVLAARWVQAHSNALPTTLGEISTLPMAYRRAIQAALPPEARVALWREQLEPWAAPGSGLNDRQRAAVREVIERLPALHSAATGRAEARALSARVLPLFEPALGARIFAQLGPAPAAAKGFIVCGCSRNSSADCPGGSCEFASCHPLASGCGFGGAEPCDGLCVF